MLSYLTFHRSTHKPYKVRIDEKSKKKVRKFITSRFEFDAHSGAKCVNSLLDLSVNGATRRCGDSLSTFIFVFLIYSY